MDTQIKEAQEQRQQQQDLGSLLAARWRWIVISVPLVVLLLVSCCYCYTNNESPIQHRPSSAETAINFLTNNVSQLFTASDTLDSTPHTDGTDRVIYVGGLIWTAVAVLAVVAILAAAGFRCFLHELRLEFTLQRRGGVLLWFKILFKNGSEGISAAFFGVRCDGWAFQIGFRD